MQQISRSVDLYSNTAIGFRLSAAVYEHQYYESISVNTIRKWVFQIGFYLLRRMSYDMNIGWAWVLDHTIQIGAYRCLAVIGIDLRSCRQEDAFNVVKDRIHLLDVHLSSDWNWSVVAERLEYCRKHCGKLPVQILSDGGKDLRSAIADFQDKHPQQVAAIQDITHYAAQVLKELLEDCAEWKALVRAVNTAKRKSFQTKWAALMPVGLRKWSRFLNLDACIKSLVRLLQFFEAEQHTPTSEESKKIEERFGPIVAQKDYIVQISRTLELINELNRLVKHRGLNKQLIRELKPESLEGLRPNEWTAMTRSVYDKMRSFLEQQADCLPDEQSHLGHTDMIESLFGGYKEKMKISWLSSFTESILTMPVLTAELNEDIVHKALSQVREKDIEEWFDAMMPEGSLLAQRRAAFSIGKQNCGNSSMKKTG